MNVRCFKTEREWNELRPHWNVLLRKSEANTIFLTWEWLRAWWSVYGGARKLCVLAAFDRNEVVGIAPFYIQEEDRWGTRWQCLRLIGHGSNDSEYLSLIIAPTREAEVVEGFFDYLAHQDPRWDLVDIDGPIAGSKITAALSENAARRNWRVSESPLPCLTLPLTINWNEYLQMLKPRVRTKVRSALAFFEHRLNSLPQQCSCPEQIAPWLEVLFDLHTRRWQRSGKPGVFRDPRKRQFYDEISRASLSQGWLALHRLDWGERPLAMQYGFNYGNRFYLLQEGYDPDFECVRPGVALRASLLRDWMLKGLAEYDFLGGVSGYKLDWGAQPKTSVHFRITPTPNSSMMYVYGPRAFESAKGALRQVVPEPMLALRRKRAEQKQEAQWRSEAEATAGNPKRQPLLALYSIPPVQAMGRFVADHMQATRSSRRLSLGRRTSPTCQIMYFHRVNDNHDPFLPAAAVANFREQLCYIAKNFRVVSLDDIASGAAFESKFSVAITFDDGYRDNFLHAFPILKQLNIPATIYLATSYVERGELPWYDKLFLAFKLSTAERISLVDFGGPEGPLGNLQSRLNTMNRVVLWLRSLEEDARFDAGGFVLQQLRVSPDLVALPNPMLQWEEIRQMAKHRITFGAHTVSHPVLAKLSRERLEEEIGGSKRTIEARLQQPVHHFAYPFGRPSDVGSTAKMVVQECGYHSAVTTAWGYNTAAVDRYELRRCNPWETQISAFALKFDWNRLFIAQEAEAPTALPQTSAAEGTSELSGRQA